MRISNHRLVADVGESPILIRNTPNQGLGPTQVYSPQYLIIHYTAGASFGSSVTWLTNSASRASAHLVIGMDGEIAQLVPFNRRAWHAGASRWGDLEGMNDYSIGIELDNPGRFSRVGHRWISSFGREYPSDVIMEATHKHKDTPSGWHIYSEAQLDACVQVSQLIVRRYGLLGILGHEDISPFRKVDPGPAFPMESFRSKVLGRADNLADLFEVTTDDTNFRTGPGRTFEAIGQLNRGVQVQFISSELNWFRVFVAESGALVNEPEGWVHSSLLRRIPQT